MIEVDHMSLENAYGGLRVCDLSQGVAGPHGTMLFAQFGAEVIKVEPPEGDWARGLGPRHGDHSAHSFAFNRGKKSIVLDLKSQNGLETVRQIVQMSDVFVESFRPGVIARLGLSYDEVRRINPRIIYASLSGFGQSGPYSSRGTVDALMQGFSGMMVMNQMPDGTPHRQNMTAVDVLAGLYLFSAVSAAVAERRRTGTGGFLDISLLQSAAAFQAAKIMEFHLMGGAPKPLYMPAGYLKTKDGAVSLATMRQAHYEALCRALDRADLIHDERFCELNTRVRNGRVLMAELESEFIKYGTDELLLKLHQAGILVERVQNYGEWLQDEHVNATESYSWVNVSDMGAVPVATLPGLGTTPGNTRLSAPGIGEQSAEILQMLAAGDS